MAVGLISLGCIVADGVAVLILCARNAALLLPTDASLLLLAAAAALQVRTTALQAAVVLPWPAAALWCAMPDALLHSTLHRPCLQIAASPSGLSLLLFYLDSHLFLIPGPPLTLLLDAYFCSTTPAPPGDQTQFCRATDFRAVGGFNSELIIMEDADLCIRMHEQAGEGSKRGRVRMLPTVVQTSGRRISSWGAFRSTYIQFRIALEWYLGEPLRQLSPLLPVLMRLSHGPGTAAVLSLAIDSPCSHARWNSRGS